MANQAIEPLLILLLANRREIPANQITDATKLASLDIHLNHQPELVADINTMFGLRLRPEDHSPHYTVGELAMQILLIEISQSGLVPYTLGDDSIAARRSRYNG